MSRRAKIITGVAAAIVLAAVAAVVWWLVRGDEPAAVDLQAAVAQLETVAGDSRTPSSDADPEVRGADAAPVAEGADDGPAAEEGSDAAAATPDEAASDDDPPSGPSSDSETEALAAESPDDAAGAVSAAESAGEVGAAAAEDSEVADAEPDVGVADDVPPAGDGTEPESTAVAAGPDEGGEGAAPAEDVAEVTLAPDLVSDVVVADDVPPAGDGTEAETAAADVGTGGLAGLWKMVVTEGADALAEEGAVSFAGFRVQEVLAGGIGENTAVGRTAEVSGYIELTDTALATVNVVIRMSTVRTDDSHRDSHMRQALNTGEFPLAAFTLTEPIELPVESFEGEPFSGTAEGDLTVKGVTNRAVFDLHAQLVGDVIVVVGSSEVVFSDYGVPTPRSAAVISVEDHGVMEFQFYFMR